MNESLAPQAPRSRQARSRRWVAGLIGSAVSLLIVVLVWNLFTGALFFYNADEAIERRSELGESRFTLQGTPIGCSIVSGAQADEIVTAFTISFNGALVDVVHRGEPAELFEGGTPVVLDGKWVESQPGVSGFQGLADDGWHYSSDRMRIKHDEDYINDDSYEGRLAEAESFNRAEECST